MPRPPAIRFLLERWIQRGALFQLLVMSALVALVSTTGGLLAWLVTDQFATPGAALWWAFLRLTDPGYLGDDEGLALRVISTAVTVLGYVVFMGTLIAIMTQWLSRTIRLLELGLTPISMTGHVVILGWTNRTPEIVARLLYDQGRLRRFLRRRHIGRLRIVVQSDEVTAERRLELRASVRNRVGVHDVLLRSGSSLEPDHLERLDIARAAVVVIPGADFALGGVEMTDTRVIKTLLTLRQVLRRREGARPYVVAEILDPAKVPIALSTMPRRLEIIASDAAISRVISQSIRHERLARVLLTLVAGNGTSSLYVRATPELEGAPPVAVNAATSNRVFPRAVVLGAVRARAGRNVPHLNPDTAFRMQRDDLLVLLAESYEDCRAAAREPGPFEDLPAPVTATSRPLGPTTERRILVLGWSYKVTALLSELADDPRDRFQVTVVSKVPVADRESWLVALDLPPGRVAVEHIHADYSVARVLAGLEPAKYQHIVFLASNWMQSSEESDARTVLGYVLLSSLLAESPRKPEITVELLDPANARLFPGGDDVVLVSPRLLSHLLAQVALRPELNAVFTGLLGSEGPEVQLHPAADYGLGEQPATFAVVQEHALGRGEVALGVLTAGPGGPRLQLNPPLDQLLEGATGAEVVVLSARAG